MKKTNYFSTAIAEWLDELEHMGKDCRTLELDGDRVKLRITPCKLPGNEGGCVALLTVKAGESHGLCRGIADLRQHLGRDRPARGI